MPRTSSRVLDSYELATILRRRFPRSITAGAGPRRPHAPSRLAPRPMPPDVISEQFRLGDRRMPGECHSAPPATALTGPAAEHRDGVNPGSCVRRSPHPHPSGNYSLARIEALRVIQTRPRLDPRSAFRSFRYRFARLVRRFGQPPHSGAATATDGLRPQDLLWYFSGAAGRQGLFTRVTPSVAVIGPHSIVRKHACRVRLPFTRTACGGTPDEWRGRFSGWISTLSARASTTRPFFDFDRSWARTLVH